MITRGRQLRQVTRRVFQAKPNVRRNCGSKKRVGEEGVGWGVGGSER